MILVSGQFRIQWVMNDQTDNLLIQRALRQFSPDIFQHPVWIRFAASSVGAPASGSEPLLRSARQMLAEHDIPGACAVLFLCAARLARRNDYDGALESINQVLKLAKHHHLSQVAIWGSWAAGAVCVQMGAYAKAAGFLLRLQQELYQANDWVLANLVELVRQSLLEWPEENGSAAGHACALLIEQMRCWGKTTAAGQAAEDFPRAPGLMEPAAPARVTGLRALWQRLHNLISGSLDSPPGEPGSRPVEAGEPAPSFAVPPPVSGPPMGGLLNGFGEIPFSPAAPPDLVPVTSPPAALLPSAALPPAAIPLGQPVSAKAPAAAASPAPAEVSVKALPQASAEAGADAFAEDSAETSAPVPAAAAPSEAGIPMEQLPAPPPAAPQTGEPILAEPPAAPAESPAGLLAAEAPQPAPAQPILPPLPEIAPAPLLNAYLLGSFRVELAGALVENWPSGRCRAVFAYLLDHHAHAVPREELIEAFWPEIRLDSARNSLNVAIYTLRHALRAICAEPVILLRESAYQINPDLPVWVDVEAFEQHARDGLRLETAGSLADAACEYRLAVGLYLGDFMADTPYEDWTTLKRERLRMLYLETLDHLSRFYFNQGAYDSCVGLCQRILSQDACREDAHCRLMRCYARQGQVHQALRQYQACVEALRAELDVEPSPSTVQLCRQIKRQEAV